VAGAVLVPAWLDDQAFSAAQTEAQAAGEDHGKAVAAHQVYLSKRPAGRHADEVKAALDDLNFKMAGQKAQAVGEDYGAAIAAYKAYLKNFPAGRHADEARAKAEEELPVVWDDYDFKQATQRAQATGEDYGKAIAAYQAYLSKHPAGRHADQAKTALGDPHFKQAVQKAKPAGEGQEEGRAKREPVVNEIKAFRPLSADELDKEAKKKLSPGAMYGEMGLFLFVTYALAIDETGEASIKKLGRIDGLLSTVIEQKQDWATNAGTAHLLPLFQGCYRLRAKRQLEAGREDSATRDWLKAKDLGNQGGGADHKNGTKLPLRSSGKHELLLQGHSTSVNSAAFSSDGKGIVTASDDKTARVWEAETGKEVCALKEYRGGLGVAFSPDGKRIVTASWPKTARVWEAETGKEVCVLRGHAEYVESAAFSPDGKSIVTASKDNTARVWEALDWTKPDE
jgi:DNA-binding ferritin-like protein (Dps family)